MNSQLKNISSTMPAACDAEINQDYFKDSLSLLNILSANEFEDQTFSPAEARNAQIHFYKGAPPQWVNFFLAEREAEKKQKPTVHDDDGRPTTFVKRDLYQHLREKIIEKTKRSACCSVVHLSHQTGSGGSTLVMQVLWDLRKKLKCAVLKQMSIPADIEILANEIISLFGAGNKQNTVLLLLQHEVQVGSLMSEIANRRICAEVPVLIILKCLTNEVNSCTCNGSLKACPSFLQRSLSNMETKRFEEKQREIEKCYQGLQRKFHGLNILCSNFSKDYIENTCKMLEGAKKKNRPRNEQLLALLSLLNFYIPGSYLLQSECATFLKTKYQNFENRMKPYDDLIVTFTGSEEGDKQVKMKHSLLARKCFQSLEKRGVAKCDTVTKFMQDFCLDPVQNHLVHIIKTLLTKRELNIVSDKGRTRENKEPFSQLILHMFNEGFGMAVSVLKRAVEVFPHNFHYPQTLARFYYIKHENYEKAEFWAQKAIQIDPNNSFVADTLGQVYKSKLNKLISKPHCPQTMNILRVARNGFKAFLKAEELSEHEIKSGKTDFNYVGRFGFLQVAKHLFNGLTKLDSTWQKILRREITGRSLMHHFKEEHRELIENLQDAVKQRCTFFDTCIVYSQPSKTQKDPHYVSSDVIQCFRMYTQDPNNFPVQEWKVKLPASFPKIFAALDPKNIDPYSNLMTQYRKQIDKGESTDAQATQNYVLASILFSQEVQQNQARTTLKTLQEKIERYYKDPSQTPEIYLLTLMLFWPESDASIHNTASADFPFNRVVALTRSSYNEKYRRYFSKRHLIPLFYLGQGEGLRRLIHRSTLNITKSEKTCLCRGSGSWETPEVKGCLQRVKGEVTNHELFACIAHHKIEVSPDTKSSIRNSGQVSFFLGFNIAGPVAFNIKYEK